MSMTKKLVEDQKKKGKRRREGYKVSVEATARNKCVEELWVKKR